MTKIPLWFFFFLGFCAVFLFGSLRLFYFAPFLTIVLQRSSLPNSLIWAAICGGIIDLLGSPFPLGVSTLLTLFCTLICFRFRKWFFEENIFSIPLYTILFSSLFCLLQLSGLPFSLLMSLLDGLYAFFWFTCPALLFRLLTNLWYNEPRRVTFDHRRKTSRLRNRGKS